MIDISECKYGPIYIVVKPGIRTMSWKPGILFRRTNKHQVKFINPVKFRGSTGHGWCSKTLVTFPSKLHNLFYVV